MKSDEDIYEELLEEYNIFEGIECDVVLPEKQLKTSGSSGAKKGLATLAFGVVGWAATSGVTQSEENREIHTVFQVVDKGIVFKNAKMNGSDLKIPYSEIIEMEMWTHKSFPSFGKIILLENKHIIIKIDLDKKRSDMLIEHITEIIDERACGAQYEESGWGFEHATHEAPQPETNQESNSLMDELERLGNMYKEGLLTDEEFALAKKKLLEGG